MIQIVCACKNLVEVVDGLVVEHAREGGERCLASGMRHVSQKSTRCPSQPGVEVVAVGPVKCPDCGEVGLGALVVVRAPDPTVN